MRTKHIICQIVMGLGLATGLGACSDADTKAHEAQKHYPVATVGVSVSSIQNNPFFQGMYRSFETVGQQQQPSLTLILDSANDIQDKQNAQLESMIKQEARALVVNLIDVAMGKEMVQKMCQRKMPIVFIDRSPGSKNLAACESAFLVDGDSAQAGVLQGLQVLKGWKDNPTWDKNRDNTIQYAMLEGIPDHAAALARTKWSVGTMESYPHLSVKVQKVFQDSAFFQEQKAADLVEQWINQPEFASVEVILANNDSMALGAIAALKRHNIQLPVFGIDGSKPALQAMKAGTLAGTVLNDFDTQAKTALRLAANLAAEKPALEGIPFDMSYRVIKVPYQDINHENIDHFLKNQ